MLTRLTIANYKALRSLTLELRPITVLVGANGVGKTSVLEAVELLGDLGGSLAHLNDSDWFTQRSFGGLALSGWSVQGRLGEESTARDLVYSVEQKGDDRLVTAGWRDAPMQLAAKPTRENRLYLAEWQHKPPVRTTLLRPTLSALRSPSYAPSAVPEVESDGAGMPSVLADLAATRPDTVERVLSDLRSIIPTVRRIRAPRARVVVREPISDDDDSDVEHVRVRDVWGHRLELELDGVGWVPAEHLSEGTLRALAYLCALSSATDGSPFVFLADDFDAGLHPSAQAALVKTFRAIRERRPEVQFLCTTHSPFVLDAFLDEEVIVCARGADGAMRAMSLARHPEWSKWKAQLRAGEFWSSVGEDWVLATPETAA